MSEGPAWLNNAAAAQQQEQQSLASTERDSNVGPAWADPANHVQPLSVEDHESELFKPYSTLDEPVMETIMRDVRAVMAKLQVVLRPLDRHMVLSNIRQYYSAVATTSSSTTAANASNGQQEAEDDGGNGSNTSNHGMTSDDDHENSHSARLQLSPADREMLTQLKDWDLWGPLVLCLALAVALGIRARTEQTVIVFAAVFMGVTVGSTMVTVNVQLVGGTISFFQCVCVLGYSIFPLVLAAFAIGGISIVISWVWLNVLVLAVAFAWAVRTSRLFISLYIKPERRTLALYPVFFFYTFLCWLILLF